MTEYHNKSHFQRQWPLLLAFCKGPHFSCPPTQAPGHISCPKLALNSSFHPHPPACPSGQLLARSWRQKSTRQNSSPHWYFQHRSSCINNLAKSSEIILKCYTEPGWIAKGILFKIAPATLSHPYSPTLNTKGKTRALYDYFFPMTYWLRR